MKKCCIFEVDEHTFKENKDFVQIKNYGEIPTPNEGHRYLLKCKKCECLFLHQSFSWNSDKGDYYYDDYIQVESEDEANKLNNELVWDKFSVGNNPMILIGSDNVVRFKNIDKNDENVSEESVFTNYANMNFKEISELVNQKTALLNDKLNGKIDAKEQENKGYLFWNCKMILRNIYMAIDKILFKFNDNLNVEEKQVFQNQSKILKEHEPNWKSMDDVRDTYDFAFKNLKNNSDEQQKNMKLKVTHIPLHGAYGRSDEVERMANEAKENTTQNCYEIVLNEIIDLEKFKIKSTVITEKNCKFEVTENKGVNISGSRDRLSVIDLNLNDSIKLYLGITDNMESWLLELIKDDDKKATIRKTLVDEKGLTYEVEEELDMSVVKIPDTTEEFEKILVETQKEETLESIISVHNNGDLFFTKLVKDYLIDELKVNEVVGKKIFSDVSKHNDIYNEFTKYLVQKKYDLENAISVEGYTALDISKLNPSFSGIGVYNFLSSLRNNPEWAKEQIAKGFPVK